MRALLLAIALVGCVASAPRSETPAPARPAAPASAPRAEATLAPLRVPHVRGRAATKEDVASGAAVFAAQDPATGAILGTPIAMQIPQYAMCAEDGVERLRIVIQAEEAQGMQVVGLLMPGGGGPALMAMLAECRLLGDTTPPGQPPLARDP